MSLSSDKLNQLIEVCVGDSLKKAGYKKRGQTYYLNAGKMIKAVNFQSGMGNAMGFGRFTINIGIYVPAMDKVIRAKTTKNPKSYECQINTRIGHLMPEKNDIWWSFGPQTVVEKNSMGLRNVWKEYGEPFLEQFKNLNDIKEYCFNRNMLIQEAAVCVLLGETNEAREKIKTYLLQSSYGENPDFDEIVSEWVRNLGFPDLLIK